MAKELRPVPRATEGGKQEGRESPKEQKMRMLAELSAKKKKPAREIPQEVLDLEKAAGIHMPGGAPAEELDAFGEPVPESVPEDKKERLAPWPQPRAEKPKRKYKKREPKKVMVVSVEVENVGTFSIPATDVLDAGYGIVLLSPGTADSASFSPKPGTYVRLQLPDGRDIPCFCPGISADLPGGKTRMTAFVKASEPSGQTPVEA